MTFLDKVEAVHERVLLVEDNPDDVKLTLKAFEKSGVATTIDVAADGVEALEYLFGRGKFAGRETSVLPKLILLDLKMPRMNGLEVLQRIRADRRLSQVPVVILTTSNEEKDRVESRALGASAYMRKPVKFGEFRELVQQIAQWLDDSHNTDSVGTSEDTPSPDDRSGGGGG